MGQSDKEDDKITCLVSRDRWTKVTFANVVKVKGLTDEWIIQQIYDDLRSLGYPEIRLRSLSILPACAVVFRLYYDIRRRS